MEKIYRKRIASIFAEGFELIERKAEREFLSGGNQYIDSTEKNEQKSVTSLQNVAES